MHAPGQHGLVMICFTLPSFDVVFKVIRDHIPDVKSVSKKEVMAKYSFVFLHDRAGRLIDAQEFRRLRFPLARFSAPAARGTALRGQRKRACRGRRPDHSIICYIERRVTPLDVYLRRHLTLRRAARRWTTGGRFATWHTPTSFRAICC